MRILLVCASGMSTSILVANMRKYAEKNDIIEARSASELERRVQDYDVVLVGPQIRGDFEKINGICEEHQVKAGLIDMSHYGRMDGNAVLAQAGELIKKAENEKENTQMGAV